jgi:tetratricopeptide (TPR) repeat protein
MRFAASFAALIGATVFTAGLAAAQTPAPAKPAPKSRPPATAGPSFDEIVKSAEAARKAEQWEQAVDLYGKAVKLRPSYTEGIWYQAAAYYSLDKFAECRDAFKRVTRAAPNNGAAFAFLGLCEFGVKEFDRSLQDLVKSRILGVADRDLGSVARYHASILMTRIEQFDQALQTLGEFAAEGTDNPRIIEAMGIATLRMPMLPNEVPPERREMILMAGRGSYMMATRQTAAAAQAFEGLVTRYPETPNVHYAYAVYLLIEQPEKAIEEFKRELQIQPNHPDSLMQIAFEYLKESNAEAAMPWAKQAVAAAPKNFAAHKALGDALLASNDIDGAIAELELSARLAPDSPSTHLSLAKAYQRAGRSEAAMKEREEFARLDRLMRTNRSGEQSVGGIGAPAPARDSAPPPQ